MENQIEGRHRFSFVWSIVGLSLLGIGIYFRYVTSFKFESIFSAERSFAFFIYLLGAFIIWFVGLWLGWRSDWMVDPTSVLQKLPKGFRYFSALFLLSTPTILSLYTLVNEKFLPLSVRVALFWACTLLATIFVFPRLAFGEYFRKLLLFGLLAGLIFSANRYFIQVSSYPFSLGWSEGNRIWDYSILFGSNRYNHSDNSKIYAFIDRGRAFVWGLPFLFRNLNMFWFRFYDALVKTVPYFLLGVLLIWNKKNKLGILSVVIFGFWIFMFLLQGPIYSPLIFIAILTVVAVQQKNLFLSAFLVFIAGYFAFLTRFSWIYAPGLWAGMLSLINISSPKFVDGEWKKLFRPILLGMAGLFGGRYLTPFMSWIKGWETPSSMNLSVLNLEAGAKALVQPLLWDRWWPNATYGPGIIIGILLTAGPLVVLLYLMVKNKNWKLNWMQILGILIPTTAFFMVGLVASVKIGGGGDLHNLDMFLVTLALLSAYIWPTLWNLFVGKEKTKLPKSLIIFSIIVFIMPVFWTLRSGDPLTGLISKEKTEIFLDVIQEYVDDTQANGGKVLFMDQRQLITFDNIKDVLLFDEYEKKLLIDNGFSQDEKYFSGFYEDLESHKFDLILTERLFLEEKEDTTFSNENNTWLKWVAIPLSENYCAIIILDDLYLELMIPGNECDEATHY